MLIGQLSKQSKLSRDTIRFYEKKGVIPEGVKSNEFNDYKDYPNSTLQRLLLIKKMKTFGFTLNEICDFIDLIAVNSATCEIVSKKISAKVQSIDRKISELEELKAFITEKMQSCLAERNEANCPLILERSNEDLLSKK